MANTAKSTTKKTNKKSITKKVPHLYKEKNPDSHTITGKFTVLYIIFAVATLIFAAISVYLFFFSSQILEKYENIDAVCRKGNCQLIINDNSETNETNESEE